MYVFNYQASLIDLRGIISPSQVKNFYSVVTGVGELALLLLAGEEVLPSKLFKTAAILVCSLGFSACFSVCCQELVFICVQVHVTQCVSIGDGVIWLVGWGAPLE
ncbi:hypothetical protein ILYODFUR_019141 [Ilyodon furcidens]|uniref:Uncharacterized protein n=1 Tax=Ilyodon furcidens TaxID=33524 RepID=A0ABV0UTN2_9TELE